MRSLKTQPSEGPGMSFSTETEIASMRLRRLPFSISLYPPQVVFMS